MDDDIPMDNNKEKSSSREGVQRLFNKNIELENKRRKAVQAKIPSDPNTWQHMRENYEAIVLEDHAFSEQHDIEYALWQLHYRRIEELRALFNAALASSGSAASQNGKGPVRDGPVRLTKLRSQLRTFLSEATGFYHDLMLKIRAKYGLPLGFFSDDSDNQIPVSKDGEKFSELKKGLMSCHRCLIYLGDLARYKGIYGEGDSKAREFTAASSYYMQASSLWPSSGNPHHQLAILAGYSNEELLSIYRYFRSLAVDNPFITARDNLIIAFEKNRQNYTQLGDAKVNLVRVTPSRVPGKGRGKGETRQSYKENNRVSANSVKEGASNKSDLFKAFVTRFVRMNGILFTRTSLETFPEIFSMVKNDLLELLSSGSDEEFAFGADSAECKLTIVRMVAIVIFTVHNLNKDNENQSYADILQRSVLLQNALTAAFEFMGSMLERCYQSNDPSSSYLLPGIMVFVEWLACRHDVAVCIELEEKQVDARTFFWNKCISLLNKLLSSSYLLLNEDEDETCFSNMSKYDESETANRLALPEDFELRGFLPLVPAQIILDFSRKHSFRSNGGKKEKGSRIQRIIASGKALTNVVRIGQEGFYFDTKLKEFVMGAEPQISDDYLFSSSLESSVNANTLNISIGRQMDLSVVPQFEGGEEVEDEDEVIVFKPSTVEKHFEDFASKFSSSQILASVGGVGPIGLGCENGSLSVGHDSLLVQNPIMIPPTTFANDTSQYLQPAQISTSKWLVEQAQTMNGLAHLHLMENELSLKSELEDQFRTSQPATLSVPYPQGFNASTSYNHPIPIREGTLPSKFDSIIPSGATFDSLAMKQYPIFPSGLKKNPVSRPVRHLGPPPGFGYVPSKGADESPYMALKNDNPLNPQMDDYSWLDGYHFPSSNKSVGFSNSLNLVGPTFHSVSNSNDSMGITSFPFPGKQLSALQVQSEYKKSLGDYQFSENMKLYDDQQQQFHNRNQQPIGPVQQYKGPSGNQQAIGPAQQYQGQSFRDGRFFV